MTCVAVLLVQTRRDPSYLPLYIHSYILALPLAGLEEHSTTGSGQKRMVRLVADLKKGSSNLNKVATKALRVHFKKICRRLGENAREKSYIYKSESGRDEGDGVEKHP